ncbi:hypothetical protein Q5H93_21830 [Hymenobacter sp. ASUV-10]|uniref:DUF3087 family protein n=1 Tax=Hymenobacter aranciens TaxID=3063996 RepID=A0ABT9BGM0_9BACT|nr:hypothetical protein [Hymenobacter sp. ASUV-10]MDO7877396.1 hypothetical protein [Hymenobacter sp. ASUV-10]
MVFQQKLPFRSTVLGLRSHGLYLCQRNVTGHVTLEMEMPYEEMLPLRLERRRQIPWGVVTMALVLGACVWLLSTRPLMPADALYQRALLIGGGVLAWFGIGLRHWWTRQILHTSRLHLVLADTDRAELRAFTNSLEQRTKAYLRSEYGSVNPLGYIEPQLRRLHWLRELEVLSTGEVTALTTRLTGRLTAKPLRSMGQQLEAPYVN